MVPQALAPIGRSPVASPFAGKPGTNEDPVSKFSFFDAVSKIAIPPRVSLVSRLR
jgi:hypothetical protein